MKFLKLGLLFCAAAWAQVPIDWQAVMNRVSADSLRGHVSFLASDLLEGRDTPSPGLDIAAEYIAAQFRRAGLEPLGRDGYFLSSTWHVLEQNPDGFLLSLSEVSVPAGEATLAVSEAIHAESARVWKVTLGDSDLAQLKEADVAGKVVVVTIPELPARERGRAYVAFRGVMQRLSPLCVVLSDPQGLLSAATGRRRLFEKAPEEVPAPAGFELISVRSPELARTIAALPAGETGTSIRLRVSAPRLKPVELRNVAGILRGSDPALRDTYVMVNAHYDHIGALPPGPGDRVYNGANDDASGTVSVIELAAALAPLPARPRRSILFAAFFGEEKGILGSRQFARNPPVPIERIVGAISLEQVGRTDSGDGPLVNSANLTGFDFSDLSRRFVEAGKQTGVRVWKDEAASDPFFNRSDNIALAEAGVPSHTLSVAYTFPDYHRPGDHWDKIDYENMARVVRTVALGLLMTADDPRPPRWNEAEPKTERYRKLPER
jgi:hypothetical protein